METSSENNDKVIRKNDPDFPGYMDFDVLRSEGILHIGELSGKIWTDHNIHDPGITILEMLCYALIDLGYRTQLPVEDLLTSLQENESEDNFFTPGQVLTTNPVTMLDYRKLIIDTPGIRNAWLEIHDESVLYLHPTYLNDNLKIWSLSCDPAAGDLRAPEITLNGLYDVYLELERPDLSCPVRHEPSRVKEIVDKVREKLNRHRNLGEDFVRIHILCEEEISLCGKINLTAAADPVKVHAEMLKILFDFFSPPLRFYTLNEMLDMDLPIEEIFAGRPWLTESYGFMLDKELEKAGRVSEIHISDVYALIGNIEGVASVTDLKLISNLASRDPQDCDYWTHRLSKDHVPVFCADRSCFDFYKNGSNRVRTDLSTVLASFKQKVAADKKARYLTPFDKPIPRGNVLEGLGDYYSIQHEFPRTYAIGEGGLPADASDLRKSQALQLKGYLLFYDQLLSNYLSQLNHIRDLFSFNADSVREEADQHTYFGGELDTVPQIEKLIRFYTDTFEASSGWVENTVLAIPVSLEMAGKGTIEEAEFLPVTFSSDGARELQVDRLQREFIQNEFTVEILPDECGYIFSILLTDSPVRFLSKRTYKNRAEAGQAAKTVTFLATLDDAYRRINHFDIPEFSFEIIYRPVNYLNYLQTILEDKNTYVERRGRFLDHLLDRFAEQFTDFALLAYADPGTTGPEKIRLKEAENECKARFLTNFPEINRNRGRAYNYQLNGWDNGNISGLERRIAALSCMNFTGRKSLCNFEIFRYEDEFVIRIRDSEGKIIFSSGERYASKEDATDAYRNFVKDFRKGVDFLADDRPEENSYGIRIAHTAGSFMFHKVYNTASERDLHLKKLTHFFYPESIAENVFVSGYITRLTLIDHQGRPLKQSRKIYPEPAEANREAGDFAEKINNQLWTGEESERIKLDLIPAAGENLYLDLTGPVKDVYRVAKEYRWTMKSQDETILVKSADVFANELEAAKGLARIMEFDPSELSIEKTSHEHKAALEVCDKGNHVLGWCTFDEEKQRDTAVEKLKTFLGKSLIGEKWLRRRRDVFAWELWQGRDLILRSAVLFDDRRKAAAAAEKTSKLCKVKENFGVSGKEDGFRLTVYDKNDLQAVSIRRFGSEEDARKVVEAVRMAWDGEGLTIPENEEGFQYTIPGRENDPDPLLISYHVYRTREDALNGIHDMLKIARRKRSYYEVGDEANLNFNFLIRASGGRFLARHPSTFNTANERDRVMQRVLAFMKSVIHPVPVVREFACQLVIDDEILLSSTGGFTSEEKAREGFREILACAGNAGNYDRVTAAETYSHHLFLRNDRQEAIAAYPYDFVEWDKEDEIIGRITNYLRPYLYKISAVEYPAQWKFRYGWINPEGNWDLLLESRDVYENRDDAKKAYAGFIRHLPGIQVGVEDAGSLVFRGGKDIPEGISTARFPAENIEEYKKAAEAYLASARAHMAILSEAMARPEDAISVIPGNHGGNFVYRVIKKDEFMAFHPCDCGEKPLHTILERLFTTAQGGYGFLEICLGGDICEKINGKYHFLIRDQKNNKVYLKSYTGYPSEEAARSAFEELYLLLLHKASDSANYGPFDPENIPVILAVEEFEHDLGNCSGKAPVAVVEKHTAKKFNTLELADLFCTYPIRIEQVENADKCIQEEKICYYFHLVNPQAGRDDDCKIDWRSKKCYDSVKEARWAFRYFLNLLKYRGNYHHHLDMDRCCYELVIREVLLESTSGYPTEEDSWKALEELTGIACEPSAFFIRWDEPECRFSIKAVTATFEVVCNPRIYYNRETAQQDLDSLVDKMIQYQPVQQFVNISQAEKGTFSFTISSEKEKVLWNSYQNYPTREDAVSAAWKTIDLAREVNFYGEENDHIILYTKNRQFVLSGNLDPIAIHPKSDKNDRSGLISMALRFPLSRDEAGFYYRVYDTSGNSGQEIPDILLENTERTRSFEEIQESFSRMMELARHKANYEIIDRGNCGRYVICLTDPSAIIAFHPLYYGLRSEADESVARILDCLNMEGLHLLEHILLRPQTRENCECFLQPFPDTECKLEIPLPEKECADQGYENDREEVLEYIPGSDPYSFWATVVLPGWPKRMCRLETREAFQDLMRKEAPAHLALNILWLSPQQMCKFETAFRHWLRWKSCKNICGNADPVCMLIECLGELVNYDPCITPEETEDCDCELPGAINRTNLFINYAFSSEREKNYGPDFLRVLGFESGSAFSGTRNVITLPKTSFSALFKKEAVPFVTGSGEITPLTGGDVVPETEIARGIRKRIAGYKSNIETITDSKFLDTEYYERSDLFLMSSGDHAVYAGLMDLLHLGYSRARSDQGRERFVVLIANVSGYYFDRHLMTEQHTIGEALKENLEQKILKSEPEGLQKAVLKVWDSGDWSKWYGSKAAAEIEKMLKTGK